MWEVPGYGIAALFDKHAAIFDKHAAIRRTRRIFTAKSAAIRQKAPRLRHFTRRCGALRHGHQSVALLAGESGMIYAMFSSSAVPRLLHSFWRVLYIHTCTLMQYKCTHITAIMSTLAVIYLIFKTAHI